MRMGFAALLLCSLLASAGEVRAQAQARTPAEAQTETQPQPNGAYEVVIRDAVREYNLGNYAEASVLFDRAHRLRPSARTLRGIGLCEFELKHYASAITALSAALEDGNKPLSEQQRGGVNRALDRAREFVASYTVAVPVGVTQIEVDGAPRALASSHAMLLDPGPHTLAIITPTGDRVVRELVSEVGARGEVAFVAQAAGANADSAPRAHGRRLFTWIALGATGVFTAGIVGFGLAAHAKHDDFERLSVACDGCESAQVKAARSSGQDMQTLTNVSIALSGVAAAATVALFVLEPRWNAGSDRGVGWEIGPTGAQLHGRF